MKMRAAPLNLIQAKAYAAIAASTSGNTIAGMVIASEFTKYAPSCGADADEENSTSR